MTAKPRQVDRPGPRRKSAAGTEASPQPWWQRDWVLALGLAVAAFLVYLPVWHAGFIWDDDKFLVNSPLIHAPDGLYRFWCTTAAPDYFPMTSTTLWLEWRLWGANALGYHLTNVFLHALSGLLLWRTLLRLKIPGAWLAALLFVVHPVNVESVAWITERKNTLAMTFYALTLLMYLRFEDSGRWRWYWVSVGAFALALLSKTAVAPLPLILLGIAWWRRGRVTGRDVARSLPFFGAALLLGLVTIWFQYYGAGSIHVRNDSLWLRVVAAGWAICFYLWKAILPLNLIFVYPRSRILQSDAFMWAPALLLAIGFLLMWCYRRTWGRSWLFGLGYFALMLSPVLGFLNVYFMRFSLVADHYQYFSIIGPLALAAAGLVKASGRFGKTNLLFGRILCGALALALGLLSARQCGIYADAETLWRATIARNPACWIGYNNLGSIHLARGQTDEAIECFTKALDYKPDFDDARFNLSSALYRKGRLEEAGAQFGKVSELPLKYAQAPVNWGIALLTNGLADDSLAVLRHAVELNPDFATARGGLALALGQKGRFNEALLEYQHSLRLRPPRPDVKDANGAPLFRQELLHDAFVQFQSVVDIQPDNPEARNCFGWVLQEQGQMDRAIAQFQKAVEIKPDFAEAHNELGKALLREGRAGEAIAHFQRALDIQANNFIFANNLAWVLATTPAPAYRDGSKAVTLARHASNLTGGKDPLVLRTLAAAYAEAGRFDDAIATARQAQQLALGQNNQALAASLETLIGLFRSRSPFREQPQRAGEKGESRKR